MSVEWVKLGNVVEVIRGASPRPKGDPRYFGGDIPWVMIADVTKQPGKYLSKTREGVTPEGAKKSRLLKAGTLILSNSGTVCVPKILAVDGCIHDGFVAFPDLPPTIDKTYLYHYFNFIRPRIIQENKQGITQVNLNTNIVKDIDFPLRPLEDQQKIVAEIEKQLSRLDEAVASLKRIQTNLKRYKATVLKAAVEGGLTEQWRKDHPDIEPADQLLKRILAEHRAKWEAEELAKMQAKGKRPKDDSWKKKYKEPAGPDTANLPELPEGWVWASLGQFAWSLKDGPHYSPKYSDTGVPFISGGNVRPEGIDFSTAKYISKELHDELSLRCKPEFGDLLYTKGGTTGIARINTETRMFNVWVHVAVLKLIDSIEPFYLQHALNSSHCYKQSQQYTHGVGNQDLGLTRMVWITVPLPPLQEQKPIFEKIDHHLSVTEELEATIEINVKRAERLRQVVLKEAFSGP